MESDPCILWQAPIFADHFLLLSDYGSSLSDLLLPLAGVMLLLLCSALVSGSEVAYFSLSAGDLFHIQQEGSLASRRILYLKSRPRTLLATILISNNFINIAIVILSDFILRYGLPLEVCRSWAVHLFGQEGLGWITAGQIGQFFHFAITIVGVTFLLVLFGEVSPKIYAKFNNIALAKLMSAPLALFSRFFHPLIFVLVRGSRIIEVALSRRAGTSSDGEERKADIHEAIELTVRQDQGGRQEIDILKSIIDFGDVTVKQIMRSRVDVVAVDFRISYRELLKVIRDSGFSRIPVFDEDLDNITGILYVKDLLGKIEEDDQFEWQVLIRTDVLYVPESKKIQELLKVFQERHLHMAIVVDEYGGSSGIVTLEDILEEIIGEIRDEFDEEEEVEYEKLDDYNYVFEGKTLLKDACRVTGINEAELDRIREDADTVAGLVLELLGYLPRKGVEVEHPPFKFKVVGANERRIEKVRITLPSH